MTDDEDPPVPLFYRLFGWWVRREACRLAALAIRSADVEENWTPRIWSLVVFFENYLLTGARGTRDEFGPPEPVEIREIISGDR